MSAMYSGIGETIEVIPRSGVRTEGRWALIPARVLECVVSPRGAIHGCRLGSIVLARLSWLDVDDFLKLRLGILKWLKEVNIG